MNEWMNEWINKKHKQCERWSTYLRSTIVFLYLFTFDCLLSKRKRLWKLVLLLLHHHHHKAPPSTEIISRNLMLSFIRLPNHSFENACKYPFGICFIHACASRRLFVHFHSVGRFLTFSGIRLGTGSSWVVEMRTAKQNPKYIGHSSFLLSLTMCTTLY